MHLSAGFWARFAAMILDGFIVLLPITLILYMFTGDGDHFLTDILYNLYHLIIPIYFGGKTIGKHIIKIKIVDYDLFGPPTWWMMIKRYIIFGIFIVLSLGIVFIVDVCFVIFREDKRALHDIFAGTAVIEDI